MLRRWLCLLTALCLLGGALPAVRAEATAEWTVLVYFCGSNLESEDGQASADIREILSSGAGASGAVCVLAATGGASKWQRYGISASQVQYYDLSGDAPALLDDAGRACMGAPSTLSAFIRYGLDAAPARHYALILWDHGGGPVYGVCNDENFDDDALTLAELRTALAEGLGRSRLDLLVFDACLMNSIDTCALSADFADYTVASQELVSGTGLDYDAWLAPLAQSPSMDAAALGTLMAQTYVASNASGRSADSATMSVVRSNAMPAVIEASEAFSAALAPLVDSRLSSVVRLRGQLTSFGEFVDSDASDLLDVTAMCDAFAALVPDESAALKQAAADAVVCNAATRDIADQASGLSFFLPYSTAREESSEILGAYGGTQDSHAALVASMTDHLVHGGYAMTATGQTAQNFYSYDAQSGASGALCSIWDGLYGDVMTAEDICQFTGGSIWDGLNTSSGIWAGLPAAAPGATVAPTATPSGIWGGLPAATPEATAAPAAEASLADIWAGLASADAAYYQPDEPNENVQAGISEAAEPDAVVAAAQAYFSASTLTTQSVYMLQLTREDLDHLASASGVLFRQDGDALVRLGDLGETTIDWSTGLIFSMFDGAWPMLEGEMVRADRLYVQSDGSVRFVIPARVNGLRMYVLAARNADGSAQVLGATQGYDENGFAIRGSIPLEAGMTVVPLYTAVDPDGSEREYAGRAITVPEAGLSLEWARVPAGKYDYCFGLTDLSGAVQYTQAIALTF